ncbi:MAG: ATP-NAD kinase family protein [Rhodospirillaceae bacterium]|jgi:predicted polyphosphate/ATP-dependent NAD kinase|nr:ATP-NAD kinase family protein [Rhodospirillaceae bacterium]MBT6119265.1 ATP-NAD kinase family protein [Rhodospirillaceae bacterium]
MATGEVRKRLGLIVNPIAGMGGRVGLKGTDGAAILAEARRRGAVPVAHGRARRALDALGREDAAFDLLAVAGAMGEADALACGLSPRIVVVGGAETTAEDTRDAARAMADAGVDLLLFAGGDGTARDVFDAVGDRVAVLGIPTGVKMQSAVFANGPEAAGRLAGLALAGRATETRLAEVMDIDEAAMVWGRLSARLYGHARVPVARGLTQAAKSGGGAGGDDALDALARRLARTMEVGRLYILGPGTTTARIRAALGLGNGLSGDLLAIDAVRDGAPAGVDLDEAGLLDLIDDRGASILVSVIGGQGFVLGRGNQAISAAVLRRAGTENLVVLASLEKLLALPDRVLRVDTGDPATDRALEGYIRVLTGPDRSTMMRIAA